MSFENPKDPFIENMKKEPLRSLLMVDQSIAKQNEVKDAKFWMFHKTTLKEGEDLGFLSANELISERICIIGTSGSGKTSTGLRFCEESINAGIPILVLDLSHEYGALEKVYSTNKVRVVFDHYTKIEPVRMAEAIIQNGISHVLQTPETDSIETYYEFIPKLLNQMWLLSKEEGNYPVFIIVEEAHNFAPRDSSRTPILPEHYKPILICLKRIAQEGRRRGQSLVLLSQRTTELMTTLLTQSRIIFFHNVIHTRDLDVYCELIPGDKWAIRDYVRNMKPGHVIYYKDGIIKMRIVRRHRCPHLGRSKTYSDVLKAGGTEKT